jgi:hypothetical protein
MSHYQERKPSDLFAVSGTLRMKFMSFPWPCFRVDIHNKSWELEPPWHCCFAHLRNLSLAYLSKNNMVKRLLSLHLENKLCVAYQEGKQNQEQAPQHNEFRANGVLDLCTLLIIPSLVGFQYFITFITDVFARHESAQCKTWVNTLS